VWKQILKMYNKYPKGSEWRKWDLHVHTPASYLSQFPEDWDLYIKELIKAIKKHEISVIATADYFTIDGYTEILKYYDKSTNRLSVGTESVDIYILPGVELRLNIFNSSNDSLNFHVVFDPDNCGVDFIKENFLEKLKVNFRGTPCDLRERNLVAIGYAITENQDLNLTRDYSTVSSSNKAKYLKAAYSTITLSQIDIKNASKAITDIFESQNIKRKPFVKIIAGKGHGSLKSLKWFDEQSQFSRVGLTREDLTNITDLIFSNDKEDIDFYLGKHPKAEAGEIQQRFGALKGCVWGSDCHSIGALLHPSNGNTFLYTWIKADPTFEGLKQVIYEPRDRVLIQEEKPQQKIDYLVIDKVKFKAKEAEKLFSSGLIEINPNMNTVIGGKSSGKSLLLYHIAKAVDPQQVEEKMKIVGDKGYEFEGKADFDFEVQWKDGYTNSLKEDQERKIRQITYVPQMYINHLAEEKGELKLKGLIESILNQNEELKAFSDEQKIKIQNTNLEVTSCIGTLYTLLENYRNSANEIKAIGDKAAIQLNIEKVKKEIDELRVKAGFTISENQGYVQLLRRKEFHQSKVTRYELYVTLIDDYINYLDDRKVNTIELVTNKKNDIGVAFNDDSLASKFIDKSLQEDAIELANHFDKLKERYADLIRQILSKIDRHKTFLKKLEEEFKPFLTKIANQNLLKKLNEDLEKEQAKLKQIEEREKSHKEIAENGRKTRDKLFNNYNDLLQLYNGILDKLQKEEFSKIGHDLELKTTLTFDVKLFTNGFSNLLDGRSNFKTFFGDCFNDKNEYLYDQLQHNTNIKEIFEKIWSHEKHGIKFRSGVDPKDASSKLFEDYFTFKYNLKQNNDDILQMSPGKRGLVLLQLILHLSNANHPILIDQPEDNLDNRTIFNELNQFIKDKKIQRQILIVTHNANLVVSTDSEQIIVANQQGQEQGKGNKEYTFEYVSGSLEYSFKNPSQIGVLFSMGIREHVCDILEGGEDAFKRREVKYGF
jgi:hypothetical protein